MGGTGPWSLVPKLVKHPPLSRSPKRSDCPELIKKLYGKVLREGPARGSRARTLRLGEGWARPAAGGGTKEEAGMQARGEEPGRAGSQPLVPGASAAGSRSSNSYPDPGGNGPSARPPLARAARVVFACGA